MPVESVISALPLTSIGIILMLAIGLSILVRKLNLNPVLGFILAGFLLGPFALNFLRPDDPLVIGFGEMGLFILLFYLGLELSLKEFLEAGSATLGLALIDMAGLAGLGFIVMVLLGNSFLFSVVIGFMLFCTSTAIVAKFAIDHGILKNPPVQLAVSILILQDFLGILLLVLATSFSSPGSSPLTLAFTSLVFAVSAFFVVYTLSKKIENWLEKQGFGHTEITLYAIGVGLVVATLGSVLGLSTALGAYFTGFALNATKAGDRIKKDVNFLRDFFLVFFFVAFGTTIFFDKAAGGIVFPDIQTLIFLVLLCLGLSLGIIIINMFVFAVFGPLFGLSRQDSSTTAILLVPLGEFVVIIATTTAVLFQGTESSLLSPIAFMLIAMTVIVFQPLYNFVDLHRKIVSFLPNFFKL
ncbi:MAG: cation:proton antiporter, partial [Candidatus Diapherotrites archaeon]|nr:cation:proton antiporter [Candidatus Diapherotrites archaeon]